MIQYILGLCTYLKHLDIFKHIIFIRASELSLILKILWHQNSLCQITKHKML